MRFAVISDIHGNLPALDAVLEDAEKSGADSYIFAGDYCISNPYPNECISRIRSIADKYVVRGNEEKYLQYLLSQPTRIELTYQGGNLHLSHKSSDYIGDCEYRNWSTDQAVEKYGVAFINPGSCGLPLDCIREGVPYTFLELSDSGEVDVEERRVPFDTEAYIRSFKQSDQYKRANIWSRVNVRELKQRREHMTFFLRFVEEYARKIGDRVRPFSVSTWEQAFAAWEKR